MTEIFPAGMAAAMCAHFVVFAAAWTAAYLWGVRRCRGRFEGDRAQMVSLLTGMSGAMAAAAALLAATVPGGGTGTGPAMLLAGSATLAAAVGIIFRTAPDARVRVRR